MNEEQRARLAADMSQKADLFRRLIDRFGPEVLDVLAESVRERARDGLATADLDRRDLRAVMDLLWNQMGGSADFEIVHKTPERLELRVTRCIYAEEMRRLGASETGLAAFCAYDEGFCQGLNPRMRFTRTKTLMGGDDCCDHTYELA